MYNFHIEKFYEFFFSSTLRDVIKDVSVTLTPLTDFEKEIEKSAKKVSN